MSISDLFRKKTTMPPPLSPPAPKKTSYEIGLNGTEDEVIQEIQTKRDGIGIRDNLCDCFAGLQQAATDGRPKNLQAIYAKFGPGIIVDLHVTSGLSSVTTFLTYLSEHDRQQFLDIILTEKSPNKFPYSICGRDFYLIGIGTNAILTFLQLGAKPSPWYADHALLEIAGERGKPRGNTPEIAELLLKSNAPTPHGKAAALVEAVKKTNCFGATGDAAYDVVNAYMIKALYAYGTSFEDAIALTAKTAKNFEEARLMFARLQAYAEQFTGKRPPIYGEVSNKKIKELQEQVKELTERLEPLDLMPDPNRKKTIHPSGPV